MARPLTPEEKAQAQGVTVYVVWYEDHFHFGGESDSWPVRIYRSRRQAYQDRDVVEYPPPGWDAYVVREMQLDLLPPESIRAVLGAIQAGESGPIEV
jgi:hypothetical protein